MASAEKDATNHLRTVYRRVRIVSTAGLCFCRVPLRLVNCSSPGGGSAAVNRVLSVGDADAIVASGDTAARWRPYRMSMGPASWLWLPTARTLPNTFMLFRRDMDLQEPAAKGNRLDHGRQPLPSHNQRHARPMGAGPVRSAGVGRRSVRRDFTPAAGQRTPSASRCSTTASATAPGRLASRA